MLGYQEALLRALIAQSEWLSDPERIREMGDRELAVFHGSLFDRTWRILELLPAVLGAPNDDKR